jgi:hypothetical protein
MQCRHNSIIYLPIDTLNALMHSSLVDAKERLSEFESELRKLSDERDVLDRKIRGLVQVIEGLKSMSDEACTSVIQHKIPTLAVDEIGLTAAVRNYFKSIAAGPVYPAEIRDALIGAGYYGNGPQGVLLAVHSILARMEKRGEIDSVQRDGRTAYQWVSLLKRAVRRTEQEKEESLKVWSKL